MALLGNNPLQIETQICPISLYVITQGLVKFPFSGGNHLGMSRELSVTNSSQSSFPELTE